MIYGPVADLDKARLDDDDSVAERLIEDVDESIAEFLEDTVYPYDPDWGTSIAEVRRIKSLLSDNNESAGEQQTPPTICDITAFIDILEDWSSPEPTNARACCEKLAGTFDAHRSDRENSALLMATWRAPSFQASANITDIASFLSTTRLAAVYPEDAIATAFWSSVDRAENFAPLLLPFGRTLGLYEIGNGQLYLLYSCQAEII